MAHAVAQSTNVPLDLSVYGLQGPPGLPFEQIAEGISCDDGKLCVYFQAIVNGNTYCLYGYQTNNDPITVEMYAGEQYTGEVQCPTFPSSSGYASAGGFQTSDYHPSYRSLQLSFTTSGTITITIDLLATPSFTLVINLTAGGINIQSKITGNLAPGCVLSNLVSQYAFVNGAGLNLNLQLQSTTGTCSSGHLHLALNFRNAAVAVPVGGVMIPVSTFAVLAPWLVVIGLVGCIGTVFVVVKKRRQ
jgi:hypothetical protein